MAKHLWFFFLFFIWGWLSFLLYFFLFFSLLISVSFLFTTIFVAPINLLLLYTIFPSFYFLICCLATHFFPISSSFPPTQLIAWENLVDQSTSPLFHPPDKVLKNTKKKKIFPPLCLLNIYFTASHRLAIHCSIYPSTLTTFYPSCTTLLLSIAPTTLPNFIVNFLNKYNRWVVDGLYFGERGCVGGMRMNNKRDVRSVVRNWHCIVFWKWQRCWQ